MANTTAPRQFLRITKEATFGVFDPTATYANGRQIHIPLAADNAFTVRKMPNFIDRRSAGYSGVKVRRDTWTYDVKGNLATPAIPTVAAFLLAALVNKSSGPCGDLDSYSFDQGFYLERGCALVQKQYTGCKFAEGTVEGSAENEPVMLSFAIEGSQAVDTSANPINIDPATIPDFAKGFAFTDSAGALIWDGQPRQRYSSFSFGIKNVLDVYRGETAFNQDITYKSRDVTLGIANMYRSPADRVDFEAATAKSLGLTLTLGGSQSQGQASLSIAMGARNYVTSVQDNIPMGGRYVQTIEFGNYVDPNTGTDIVVTYTPPTPPSTPTPTPMSS